MNGEVLLALARASVTESFGGRRVVAPREPWLQERAATFVTLKQIEDDELRGCVGGIEARRPLGEDVIESARAAAFHDSRFPPLAREELEGIRFSVSVLDTPAPFPVRSERDALARLQPGEDGVILTWGPFRGLFLPKVWESVPDPEEFLAHLKMKAGLAPDFWSNSIELETFHTLEFTEP